MRNLSKFIGNLVFSFNINTGLFSIDLPDETGADFILDLSDDGDLIEFDNLCDLFIGHKVKHAALDSIDGTLNFNVDIANNIIVSYTGTHTTKEVSFIIKDNDLTDATNILDKISRVM